MACFTKQIAPKIIKIHTPWQKFTPFWRESRHQHNKLYAIPSMCYLKKIPETSLEGQTTIHWPTLCPYLVGTKNAPSPHTCKWNFHRQLIEYRLFYGFLNLFLLTTLQCLNKLSILLNCKHCEKQSQIIDVKFTKTSKICHIISNNWCKTDKTDKICHIICHVIPHYTNPCHIPNSITKQLLELKQ